MSKQKARDYPFPYAADAQNDTYNLQLMRETTKVSADNIIWPAHAEVQFVATIENPIDPDSVWEKPYTPVSEPDYTFAMVPKTFLAKHPHKNVKLTYRVKDQGEISTSAERSVRINPGPAPVPGTPTP